MSIQLYNYDTGELATDTPEEQPTSGIKMFNYDELQDTTQPVVSGGEVIPMPQNTKPSFKTFSDLSTTGKIKFGLEKAVSNIYQGLQENVSGSIESVVGLKDVIAGATDKNSTSAKELATDTETDKKLKDIANIYSSGAASTKQDLYNKKVELGLNPDDEFSDSLLNGVGQVMGFMAGGVALKGASALLKLGKYAGTVLNAGNSFLESGMEANDTYKELKAQGKSDQEAFEGYRHSLATNAALIGITNKIGGVFEEKNFQGMKRFAKASFSGLMGGAQEYFQTIEGNFTQGKPLTQGASEAFLIGSILGVPTALVFDQPKKDGKQSEPSIEKIQEIIDNSEATPEQKEVAQKILDGTITEEEKTAAFIDTITNPEFGAIPSEENTDALKTDISELLDQGQDVLSITNALYEQGIKQSAVEEMIAEVIASKDSEALSNQVKEEAKPFIEATKLEEETRKANEEAVKLAESAKKIEALPRAKRMAFDEVSMLLGAAEAGKRVFIPEQDSSDLKVQAVSSTFPAWIPENMRSRKVFDQVIPYWEKQEVPPNKTPRVKALYEMLEKHSVEMEKQHQERIDKEMSMPDDGVEFKTKEVSNEAKVLTDFKKRYKVDFPVIIVDKILHGKKDTLTKEAEGATDGNTIALAFDAIINTGKHELIHLTLNNLDQIPELAKFSRQDILKAQAKKMGIELTKQNEKTIEEQLALDFEAYQNKDYKPKNSILSKFFSAIDKMLKNFRNAIVKSNGDVISTYYDAVLYGESQRKYNVELKTESKVSKYLIDNVLDYSPMYQTRRVLSLSNGITSVDFKSKKPAIKEVTGLDQIRINYFASHMDGEDVKVLEDYLKVYDENQEIKPKKGELISKEEEKAIEYFNEGLKLYDTKPEQMASISAAILEQYYATTPKVNVWNEQPKFKEAVNRTVDMYKESGDLTTKILKDLEGKRTVSKQYIIDSLKRDGVKQAEKDVINAILPQFEGDTIKVAEFADKVKLELLPLSIKEKSKEQYARFTGYENVSLPNELRGDVKNYKENIYESPVKTSVGEIHFAGDTEKYFGHTRLEDMADKSTRRVIEVQSDLYQKGNLEKELTNDSFDYTDKKTGITPKYSDRMATRAKEASKLSQYNDPTAHFRMIREEIKKAAEDGKTKLQFPTGETAMKIEGLGSVNQWGDRELSNRLVDENPSIGISRLQREARLTPGNLKVGKEVNDGGNDWIITDVLGDGKFRATRKIHTNPTVLERLQNGVNPYSTDEAMEAFNSTKETFDISGKVDTNNPIYKFYEKEVAKYLKNNYKAETVTDDKGVTWYEVKLKDEYKGAVVAFKERVSRKENEEYIKKMYPKYYAMTRAKQAQIIEREKKYGTRSVSQRLEDKTKALGISVEDNYEIKNFISEVAKSENILKDNQDKIADILNGKYPYPTEVSKTAFLHTVIEELKAKNDTKLLTKAYNQLAEEGTASGQNIAFINSIYKTYDETSPETYLNKIKAEREAMAFRKDWKLTNPFAIKEKKAERVKKIKERQTSIKSAVKDKTTIKIKELDSILDSFMC